MPRSSPSPIRFSRRLRQARQAVGIPPDRLGVLIELDEATSSARISRYETGVHEPPLEIAAKLAGVLGVPMADVYCEDDLLAELILRYGALDEEGRARVRALVAGLDLPA
ncbi:MAG: XRE family transcriptional regulator [Chromatiaceae bacterium]|nr:MAG: XRE family transcriptional regulator [Chromatiaceae bacterium]